MRADNAQKDITQHNPLSEPGDFKEPASASRFPQKWKVTSLIDNNTVHRIQDISLSPQIHESAKFRLFRVGRARVLAWSSCANILSS